MDNYLDIDKEKEYTEFMRKKEMTSEERKLKWLDEHGGRNINDLKINRKGLYVEMDSVGLFKGRKATRKVYLPE